jgi:hypothetical protein
MKRIGLMFLILTAEVGKIRENLKKGCVALSSAEVILW